VIIPVLAIAGELAAKTTRRKGNSTSIACSGVWLVGNHNLRHRRVTFADGLQGKVYMGRLINSKDAGIFERLRDPSVFKTGAH
jgi:hypothetical protein